ncbi:enolase C-terminal domain-like protein [Aspergillus alliaceus]|uniref:Enolase C-terminal domain-like protein n=1 Tax=Petromyces alliaceus TaxID=209559 RepID=A0A5N7C208_PETAA|nr:enolase C-terminal domain-like protein [Aspergillus alliaceus]
MQTKRYLYFHVKPRWLFVKITADQDRFGRDEGTLEGHTQAVEGALDEIIARVAGYGAGDIEHIWQLVWRLGFYRGGPAFMSALSGIDIALVNSPSAIDSCVERLKQVKALGVDAGLDFHGRLHKPMAKQLAKALEPYRPIFIEEPLLCKHPEALKQLSDLTAIPIAFGERLCEALDIAHARGISETVRIASLAETYDVAVAPHCPLGPIALAASIQVALSTPNFVIQEMSLGMHYNVEAGDIDLSSYLVD